VLLGKIYSELSRLTLYGCSLRVGYPRLCRLYRPGSGIARPAGQARLDPRDFSQPGPGFTVA